MTNQTLGVLQRRDDHLIPANPGELRAFSVVRDEAWRLPFMLAHHREIGVERFFVVDNGSTDGSTDYLREQPDVHVFWTDAAYQDARLGMDWLELLLNSFGGEHWCLLIDADEQLVYPDSDSVCLPHFCDLLSGRRLNCLATMVVDMYGRDSLADTHPTPGAIPLDVCRYFDRSGYFNAPAPESSLPRIYGGVRARLFWPDVNLQRSIDSLKVAAHLAFDEAGYLQKHPDVREAIDRRECDSGLDHFLRYGRHEGRAVDVRPVDGWSETGYLAAHEEVRLAVEQGVFASGLEHFVRYGQFHSLLSSPWPPCLSQVSLVRWQTNFAFGVGRHHLTGANWRRRDGVGGLLLHFRLMADTEPRARQVRERQDQTRTWSEENARYRAVLSSQPGLCGISSVSEPYRNVEQMIELGLVLPPDEL